MKLVKHSKGNWLYRLNQKEADILADLLKNFPFTMADYVKISKTDKEPEAREREKLLNESLAQHRNQLKKMAENLLAQKFKESEKGLLTLDSASREILLQILNDIRVGSWRALGEPEDLESGALSSKKNLAYRNLMDLAGYFECKLLETW